MLNLHYMVSAKSWLNAMSTILECYAWIYMDASIIYIATLYVMLYNYIQYIFTQNLHVYIHLYMYIPSGTDIYKEFLYSYTTFWWLIAIYMLTKIKFKSYKHVTLVIVSMCHHVHWNILHGIKRGSYWCIHLYTHTHAYASIIFVVYLLLRIRLATLVYLSDVFNWSSFSYKIIKWLCSVSCQLSDRSNYRIKHPIIILWKYPGLDYQRVSQLFQGCRKIVTRTDSCD